MKPSNKLSLIHLSETLSIVFQSSHKWTLISALITIVRGCIPLLLLYVVKELIDVVSSHINGAESDLNKLYFTVALTAFFFLINAISGSVSSLVRERQSHYINDFVQDIIHKKTINIPYKYFEDANYQNTFYRALGDSSFRPARVFNSLLIIAQNSLTLLLILLVLSSAHWAMIPILIVSGIPIFYFRIIYTRKIYNYRKQHTEDERRVHYFNRLLTGKDFAKELRIFNLGDSFKEEYEFFKHDLRDKQWSLSKSKTKSEILVQLFATVVLLLIIAFVMNKAINGEITAGAMAMYFLALQRAYSVLQGLLGSLSSLYEDNLFLKNFFAFKNIDVKNEKTNAHFPKSIRSGIKISNLSFKYTNSKSWVLKNINLDIPRGKTIALVGNNGCGKTTLVKLLSGLYQPTSGQITIDNYNLHDISQNELANNISVIFQDFMLYNVNAQDNICYGNVRREKNLTSTQGAAQKAGINELFTNLPNGYNTTLGTLFKGSQMLSQGEWQRTALARSFYNTEAQVIILDEPTSSLDAFTESKLIAHFKEITKDKTAIIVSHRLSTIKLADIIVVMKDKSIVEVGSPQELLDKKGVYYDMINSLK